MFSFFINEGFNNILFGQESICVLTGLSRLKQDLKDHWLRS